MLADDAAREKDMASRKTRFSKMLDNMKILAEGGTLPPGAVGPAGGAPPPGPPRWLVILRTSQRREGSLCAVSLGPPSADSVDEELPPWRAQNLICVRVARGINEKSPAKSSFGGAKRIKNTAITMAGKI